MPAQVQPVRLEALPVQAAPAEPAGELDALVPASEEFMPDLTRDERILLLFSSLGQAAIIDRPEGEIQKTGESLAEKLEVPNVAAAVNRAILEGGLPLRQNQRRITNLSPRDFAMLQVYAAGGTNMHLAELLGKDSPDKVKTLNRRLFQKMDVWGREHSVRAAYEGGAFKRGVPAITLEHIFGERPE